MFLRLILLLFFNSFLFAQMDPSNFDYSQLDPIQAMNFQLQGNNGGMKKFSIDQSDDIYRRSKQVSKPENKNPQKKRKVSSLEKVYRDIDIQHDFLIHSKDEVVVTTSNNMEEEDSKLLKQIGYDIFNRYHRNYIDNSVVPPDYKLTIEDAMTLFIYGKKEQILELTVDKTGGIYIPVTGPLLVAGLTLSEALDKIKMKLSKHYVNVDFKLILNSVKKVNITVAGDVVFPGIYSVNKYGSVLPVLTLAKGIKRTGSLRDIKVIRNGKTVYNIDLYGLIVKGTQSNMTYFQSNDVLYVPKIGDTAAIQGAVKSPGIYEFKKGESISDLIHFASGYNVNAFRNGIYINRLDENYSRQVDVLYAEKSAKLNKKLRRERLKNGDVVFVKSRSKFPSGYISILGEVNVPGKYKFVEGMTLAQLVKQSQGLKKSMYDKIQIYRFVNQYERELVTVRIQDKESVYLSDRDIVQVFSRHQLEEEKNVIVEGQVRFPGKYKYLKNMTLSDLMLMAHPKVFSSLGNIELTRFDKNASSLMYLNYHKDLNFKLMPMDKINVKLDSLRDQTVVINLKGELMYPGKYRVNQGTKLSDVIDRAGGYTDFAYLPGAIFTRLKVKEYDAVGQKKVIEDEKRRFIYDQSHMGNLGVDSKASMGLIMSARQEALAFLENKTKATSGRIIINLEQEKFSDAPDNFMIQDGDVLDIPKVPESVHLIGGVQKSISIAHNSQYRLSDYIKTVGGYSKYADSNNIYVFKASGRVLKNTAEIDPGDIVYVPEKVLISFNLLQFLTNITSILSNAVTSVALINSLNNN